MRRLLLHLVLTLFALVAVSSSSAAELKALIIDGQNNHTDWPKITAMLKKSLEQSGLFKVDVERTKYTWKGEQHFPQYNLPGVETEALKEPKSDPDFKPEFGKYDVVISNFGWKAAEWPQETKQALIDYVRGGGGFAILHAADNSFGDWREYNEMIGLGGWGGRNEESGPFVYYSNDGELVRDETKGNGGSHGPEHEFSIVIRDTSHPITRGMPREWLHAQDELYQKLRGPALQMNVLATAYSDPEYKGTDRHEPMIMTIKYGDGRVFHTPMGHKDYSVACVGFLTVFNRGVEWAATGDVTQAVPDDFPTAEATSTRDLE